jgi:adenosyl cobinamide kinase/adenosyl cobinamide phosphate guanylyltransferase
MSFKKMAIPQYPPRQWAIYGGAGSGKSHFASQMKGPALVIDSDARFTEQIRNAVGEIYQLSDEHMDNADPNKIVELLKRNLPGSGVRTIVVDSLTAIMRPIINQGLVDAETAKNKISVWRDKALAMSRMQDAVSSSGCDSLWIWHTHETMDANAKRIMRASIPATEIERLRRSLNAILRVDVTPAGRRSITVEWARNGKSGIMLVDEAGGWRGMPELIEAAVYKDGVKESEGVPATFANPTMAIAWGNEQGCFRDVRHAQHAYEKCKREAQPKTASDMWAAWIADVQRRMAEKAAGVPMEDVESELVAA